MILEFNLFSIILLSSLVIVAVAAILTALRPLRLTAEYADASSNDALLSDLPETLPGVSVVVFARTDEESLSEYLESLLEQDYPLFEIIIVYDADARASAVLADRFEGVENLHVTFVPPGSHNLSRHKLANTIGVKAAKYDIVVTTTSNCLISSPFWLRAVTAPFARSPRIKLSLGYSHFDFREFKGIWRWYRQFDSVISSAQWMAAAIQGHAFRGDEQNMAFSRELFFSHKGYAKTINLHNGHDDIFVNEISRADNTRLVLSPDSILTTRWGNAANRVWSDQKERHDFTRRWLPLKPQILAGWLSSSNWLALALAVAAALAGLPSLLPLFAAVLLIFAFWGVETAWYRRAAAALHAVRLCWAVPLFLLWHPIGNFFFRLGHHHNRYKNFTWNRH
ncbi:MAG: glycosyltransferase [Muribaculum sp.]|nr:glycosyltransferase [Muribaculum sp.]